MQEELDEPCSILLPEVISYGYLWPDATLIYEIKEIDGELKKHYTGTIY